MAEQYGIDVVLHLDHAKDYDEILEKQLMWHIVLLCLMDHPCH